MHVQAMPRMKVMFWSNFMAHIKRGDGYQAACRARSYSTPFLTQHETPKQTERFWRQEQACAWARRWETFVCFVVFSCERERDVSSPTAHDLIAILQHELCKEIGQLARFLSCWVRANRTQMKPRSNNHVVAGSSSGDKQQLEINIRPPTCLKAETIKGQSQGMSYWLDVIDMTII